MRNVVLTPDAAGITPEATEVGLAFPVRSTTRFARAVLFHAVNALFHPSTGQRTWIPAAQAARPCAHGQAGTTR
jgi:hypothetical protein